MAANTTIQNDALVCLNCGQELKISFPMAIPALIAKIEAFNREHENCKVQTNVGIRNNKTENANQR